jgi:exonuclease VII large subunit
MLRGYSVLRWPGGGVVTRSAQVTGGERLEALLADGRLELSVDRVLPAAAVADGLGEE